MQGDPMNVFNQFFGGGDPFGGGGGGGSRQGAGEASKVCHSSVVKQDATSKSQLRRIHVIE